MVEGESLVGGEAALAKRMEDWGYRDKAGGLLVDAVTLYQATYKPEIDAHARHIHGRYSQPDGKIGAATARVINGRFCNVPDFANAESAQWPRSCMNVTVSYDFDRIDKDIAEAAWNAALDKWNAVCGITLDLMPAPRGGQIWATDGPLPGSTLAWSYLANDSCAASLEQRYDTTISYSIEFLTKIISHEIGHAVGLGHTNKRADIMYPSISNAPWSSYPSANDVSRMVQRYGEPAPAPDPPPPDPPSGPVVTAIVKVDNETYKLVQENGGDTDNGGWGWPG